MAEAKNDYNGGDKLFAADINNISQNANDGGGFRDTLIAGETINGNTLPVPIYIDVADGKVNACDADVQTKLDFRGFAISNSTNNNPIEIQGVGVVSGFSGLTIGAKYYVQDSVGTIGTTIGTYEVLVGIAVSETEILIQKGSYEFVGDATINAQNIGSDGTRSSVTQDITMPIVARHAIVQMTVRRVDNNADTNIVRHTFTISRKGKTTGGFTDQTDATNIQRITGSGSLSSNTLTLTGSGSSTPTSNQRGYEITGNVIFYS